MSNATVPAEVMIETMLVFALAFLVFLSALLTPLMFYTFIGFLVLALIFLLVVCFYRKG